MIDCKTQYYITELLRFAVFLKLLDSMTKEITDFESENAKYIKELETKKLNLLGRIKQLNDRFRYKQYEQKALQPFLEQTKDVRIGYHRKRLKELEFRISTEAFTTKIEKELIKEVKKTEAELAKVAEVERARRKARLVEGDIIEIGKEIAKIDEELRQIRGKIEDYYEDIRAIKKEAKKGIQNDHLVMLGDIAIIEKEK